MRIRTKEQKDFDEYVGRMVANIRKSKKIRQLDLAVELNIETASVARIENGYHSANLYRLFQICNYLGVPVQDIVPHQPIKI
jgi:transcriptional regulator with XRE-family HTH domain